MIVDDLEAHRNECRICRGGAVCATAATLLEHLAVKLSSPSIEVIDLDRHKDGCQRCREHALCHVGRAIVKAAGEALLEAGRPRETA